MIGYHCTRSENIESIKKDGFKIDNKVEMPGDLGSGVYFFVNIGGFNNAKEMAIKFAKQYRSGRDHSAALSLIEVEFDDSGIVDMRSISAKEKFEIIRRNNERLIKTRFDKLKKNIGHYSGSINRGNLDGYVFELLKDLKPEIKGFLKDTYTPLDISGYKRSSFPNAVECCVYNVNLLKILSIEAVS